MSVEGLFYLTTAVFGFLAAAYLSFSVSRTRVGGLHKVLLLYMASIIFISLHVLYSGVFYNCVSSACYAWDGVFGLIAELGFVVFFYASYRLYYFVKTFDFE